MDKFSTNARFLNERYPGFANTPEVKNAARRAEAINQVSIPKEPEKLIQNYLDRFSEILQRQGSEKARGIAALKKLLTEKFVIRVEDVPESYWTSQMQVVRNLGMAGDWQHLSAEEVLKQKEYHLKLTKEDQKGSLEEWIDFLSSDKAAFLPDYLKYWVFQGMLRLERYEKGNKEKAEVGRFPERSSGKQRSVKPFPELNERGLKFIAQAYKELAAGLRVHLRHDIPQSEQKQLVDALKRKDFRAAYGWVQEYIPPISAEDMQIIRGEWKMFALSQVDEMTTSLQGKGSGWCIAGSEIARNYLTRGNLHIYYTYSATDKPNQPTIPRVAIVHNGQRVTEVRGIEWEQNIDDYIKPTTIIADKLHQPGMHGEEFYATNADTKKLTQLDKKTAQGEELTGEDLLFLYEIDTSIRYFGHAVDPRIQELLAPRNIVSDVNVMVQFFETKNQLIPQSLRDAQLLLVVKEKNPSELTALELHFLYQLQRKIKLPSSLDSKLGKVSESVLSNRDIKNDAYVLLGSENRPLKKNEIAWNQHEIAPETKAYIGPLFPGFMTKLTDVERIFTAFPTDEIVRDTVTIGVLSKRRLLAQLKKPRIYCNEIALSMIDSQDFAPSNVSFQHNFLEALKRTLSGTKPENINLVRLKVKDLVSGNLPRMKDIFQRAEELGLELCPAEIGPYYVIQRSGFDNEETCFIGMKPIDTRTSRDIFCVVNNGNGIVHLVPSFAVPGIIRPPEDEFVFRYRKPQVLE